MSTQTIHHDMLVTITRWTARCVSILLFLLWGAFFVEHLSWFTNGAQRPPLSVWLLQSLHLLILIGLLLVWRWEIAGSLMIAISGLLFFTQTAGMEYWQFYGLTLIPPVLFALCWWRSRHVPSTLKERRL